MDLCLIEKIEIDGVCYKLLKAQFYYDYYVIIAQSKREFYCSSFYGNAESAQSLFREIAESRTEPSYIRDILRDYELQNA